ncbi:MAG: hypothetical protein MJ158_02875 [Alphaproteobacteria bacterium]|nr:hypothetical protein [Alphaproteobacteria bacterium]
MSQVNSSGSNMKLHQYTGYLLEQDGQVYDLYHLPKNFVIKGNVYLAESNFMQSGRLPDMSSVTVLGDFDCSECELTSLKGAPKAVHGNFRCDYNHLKNFVGAPKIVKGRIYYMTYDMLGEDILRGFPKEFNEFHCSSYESGFFPSGRYFVPKYLYDTKLADKIHIDCGEKIDFKKWLVDNEARKKQLLLRKTQRVK